MLSCTIILLKVVHLYPAVPMHANTQVFNAISRLASSIIIAALLPPNSKIVLANLLCTSALIPLPIDVDPVNDISCTLGSAVNLFPIYDP